ncbi:MAG TPA: hypothetical protein VF756_03785 [Thermoanaerobaculia bacterium]
MNKLIHNVVILHSSDYCDRGWCLCEYLMSAFRTSVVCDEVQDPDLVALRNWKATEAAPSPIVNVFRGDSIESSIQNSIDEKILETVNRILPKYHKSGFTIEADRETVTRLLTDQLVRLLPPKREHLEYLNEWKKTAWTREELADAFRNELRWERLQTMGVRPCELDVPTSIEEAVARRYKLASPPPATTATWFQQAFSGFGK